MISSMIAAVFFCIASIIDGSGIYSGNPRAAKLSSRCLVALCNLYCPIRSVPFEMTKRMARKINAFQWPVLIPRAKAITSKIAHRILRINDVFFSVSKLPILFFNSYIFTYHPAPPQHCGRERHMKKASGFRQRPAGWQTECRQAENREKQKEKTPNDYLCNLWEG